MNADARPPFYDERGQLSSDARGGHFFARSSGRAPARTRRFARNGSGRRKRQRWNPMDCARRICASCCRKGGVREQIRCSHGRADREWRHRELPGTAEAGFTKLLGLPECPTRCRGADIAHAAGSSTHQHPESKVPERSRSVSENTALAATTSVRAISRRFPCRGWAKRIQGAIARHPVT